VLTIIKNSRLASTYFKISTNDLKAYHLSSSTTTSALIQATY